MGTVYKAPTNINRDSLVKDFVSAIKSDRSAQFSSFVDLLLSNGFIGSISNEDLEYAISDNEFRYIPIMTSNGITIGFDVYDELYIRVGIDPCKYFNKTSQCKVLVCFPMKKRAYNNFVKLFKNLMDEKNNIRLSFLE